MAAQVTRLEQVQALWKDKMNYMERKIESLNQQVELHKTRGRDLEKQLLSFQVNEGDSDYSAKQETMQLQRMCVDFHERAREAE